MERLDGGGNLRQLSLRCNDEVQVPEAHMRARDLSNIVTSHLRSDVDIETRKKPQPSALIVGILEPPMSKFVFARLARMVCSENTRIYIGSGEMSLCPVCC